MKRSIAAVAAALLTTTAASAQSYPGDPGAGTQRGIQQINNSGQVGSLTLFAAGPNARLLVRIDGAAGRTESVRIYRGQSCDDPVSTQPAYFLSDLHNGASRSVVHAAESRLLSGNYNVVVFSSNQPGARATACGHLYAS